MPLLLPFQPHLPGGVLQGGCAMRLGRVCTFWIAGMTVTGEELSRALCRT